MYFYDNLEILDNVGHLEYIDKFKDVFFAILPEERELIIKTIDNAVYNSLKYYKKEFKEI